MKAPSEGTPSPVFLFRYPLPRYYLSRSWTIPGQTIPGVVPSPVGPFPVVDHSRSANFWSGTNFGHLKMLFLALRTVPNKIFGKKFHLINYSLKLIAILSAILELEVWSKIFFFVSGLVQEIFLLLPGIPYDVLLLYEASPKNFFFYLQASNIYNFK